MMLGERLQSCGNESSFSSVDFRPHNCSQDDSPLHRIGRAWECGSNPINKVKLIQNTHHIGDAHFGCWSCPTVYCWSCRIVYEAYVSWILARKKVKSRGKSSHDVTMCIPSWTGMFAWGSLTFTEMKGLIWDISYVFCLSLASKSNRVK